MNLDLLLVLTASIASVVSVIASIVAFLKEKSTSRDVSKPKIKLSIGKENLEIDYDPETIDKENLEHVLREAINKHKDSK